MYEHKSQPLIPRRAFLKRVAGSTAFSFAMLALSLFIGVAGYHYTEKLSWLDSLLNASMILGGMGPVDHPVTETGKLFASGYALFSGLVILGAASVMIAPIAHRFFHYLHAEPSARRRR